MVLKFMTVFLRSTRFCRHQYRDMVIIMTEMVIMAIMSKMANMAKMGSQYLTVFSRGTRLHT